MTVSARTVTPAALPAASVAAISRSPCPRLVVSALRIMSGTSRRKRDSAFDTCGMVTLTASAFNSAPSSAATVAALAATASLLGSV